MSAGPLSAAVAQLGHTVRPPDPRPDAALVTAFARHRDEPAAAELVRRHGPMVYGVCRRIHLAEADDAFQAVWLVFSRRAGRVRPPGAVGAWLHGVAVKVATKARTQSFTRRRRLMATARPEPVCDPPADPLLAAVLDEELARLPDKYRRAVLLCDLGGKTRLEAAAELGWPEGTVATRLTRGRDRLAARLRRRGVTLPAVGLAAVLAPEATAAPVPTALSLTAVQVLAGTASVSPAALPLADAAGSSMTPTTWKLATLGLLTAVGLTVGGLALAPKPGGPWELKAILTDHHQLATVATAPDGRTFATLGADGKLFVWDAVRHERVAEFATALTGPHRLAYLSDGSLAVTGWDWDREKDEATERIQVLDPKTGTERASYAGRELRPFSRPGMSGTPAGYLPLMSISADGRRLAVPTRESYDPQTGIVYPPGSTLTGEQIEIARRLTSRPVLRLSAVGDPAPKRVYHDILDANPRLAFRPDGARLAVTDARGVRTVVFDAVGREVGSLPPLLTSAHVLWSPDNATLVRLADLRIEVYDATTLTLLVNHAAPSVGWYGATISPDGRTLAAGVRRWSGPWYFHRVWNEVQFWDLEAGKPVQGLPVDTTEAFDALAFTPDGGTLVAGTSGWAFPILPGNRAADAQVRVYVRAEAPAATPADPVRAGLGVAVPLKDHRQMVYDAAFSPDGKRFASIGADGQVIVRDTATLKAEATFEVVKNLPPEPAKLTDPQPNPPDLRLWWRANGLIRVRYDAGGDQWSDFKPTGSRIAGGATAGRATPHSDGERVIARAGDGYAVTRLDGGELFGVKLDLAAGLTGLPAADFSRDGKQVAVAELYPDSSSRLRVCDAVTGKLVADRPLAAAAGGSPVAVRFAPAGDRLFAALSDGTLVAWDAPDWAERYRLDPTAVSRGGPITGLAVSADGAQVYEAGYHVQKDSVAFGLIPTGTTTGRSLRVRAAATGHLRMSTLTHLSHLKPGWTADPDASPFIDRLAVSPDGQTVLAPQGSAARGTPAQTAAGQRAKATLAELLVYRRTAD